MGDKVNSISALAIKLGVKKGEDGKYPLVDMLLAWDERIDKAIAQLSNKPISRPPEPDEKYVPKEEPPKPRKRKR